MADEPKKYVAFQLPPSKRAPVPRELPSRQKEEELFPAHFVELALADGPAMPAETKQAQPVEPISDKRRLHFYEMRDISHKLSAEGASPSKIFYRQAQFMQDYEDDYQEEKAEFSAYFPYYQLMDYEQLRTYFTWRAVLRRRRVEQVSLSYAFVYIYELLNGIGMENPLEGLRQLMWFWEKFRTLDSTLDKYLPDWILQYFVYYDLGSFEEFAAERGMKAYYPAVFGYTSHKEDSLEIFAAVSKYPIQKSIFYTPETEGLIGDCFYYILSRLREACGKRKKCFEDFVFYPREKDSVWVPFHSALFYPARQQPDHTVALSERDVYSCAENQWKYRSAIVCENGKQLVGYLLKEMESHLRQLLKFPHKLAANPNLCDRAVLKKLKALGFPLTTAIGELVREFYADRMRRTVTVDRQNLERIRKETFDTQEKLIVPETEIPVLEKTVPAPPAPVVQATAPADGWAALKQSLTETETALLSLILNGEEIHGFALKRGLMPEVLVDGINEKAVDFIGDSLMEFTDVPEIFEEYREKLRGLVEA